MSGVVYTETGMDSDQMLASAKRMEEIGGGFASCIGQAWIRADLDNRRKLLLGFSDLFKKFHRL